MDVNEVSLQVIDCFVWCPCMLLAINVISLMYTGGLLPDIMLLLTQCYYHRGTLLNAVKGCLCSLYSNLNVLTFPHLTG